MIDWEQLNEIYGKCFMDKSRITMIETFLKTYDATQKRDVQYKLFPRQKDLCQAFGTGNNVITTKPRQAGITTTFSAFISCEMVLADLESPQTVLCIGNTLDLAQQMLFKIRDFLLQYPLWVWGDLFVDQGHDLMKPPSNKNILFDVCNSKELKLKNGCKVVARSSGPDASRGVGGVAWLVFDECAFIENALDVYTAALPTVSTGGHIVMISTPNGKDPLYYETCRRAELKGTDDWNNFEIVKLKWFQDPRYNKFLEWTKKDAETGEIIVKKEDYIDEKGNCAYLPERWANLEKDGWEPRSPWYIKMCQQFNNDRQKIAQELDVSFLGSAANVVEPEFIEMQTTLNKRDPLYVDPLEENTWIWKEPIEGHRYLMAVDNSRGDSADRTALEIIDMDGIDEETGENILEQVLEYHGKKTGDVIAEMAYQYGMMYNQCMIVVECIGGAGDATVLTLRNLNYPNIYYDDPEMKTYMIQREVSSLGLTSDGRLPGFHTNAVRYQMLSSFANLVRTNQFKIRSKRVLAELDTWIYKGKEARMDHSDGAHDDTITCLAMGLWVMNTSLKKIVANNSKMKMMLQAYISANSNITSDVSVKKDPVMRQYEVEQKVRIKDKYTMPFYSPNTQRSQVRRANPYGEYSWLLK